MDFFGAQEQARRRTARLVILFGLAAVALVAITSLLLQFILHFFGVLGDSYALTQGQWVRFDGLIFGWLALLLTLVVGFGSLYKMVLLSRGGGAAVAESLGGRLLAPDSGDPEARRLLNLVEEMAIASGTPVPSVYLLDGEGGINAFAAGLTPSNAVIALTRGALADLNRDQLQGVIAHEFSHILNGDMRLNIRLAGLLHGILLIGLIGRGLVRAGGREGSRRGRETAAFVAVGLALMATGFTGTLFANLIKASVSRQREFLADAAAVQFTRNPRGIAGALKRIDAASHQGLLQHPRAPEMSHAFFTTGVRSFLGRLAATHPPPETRIRRIEPRWNGRFEEIAPAAPGQEGAQGTGRPAAAGLSLTPGASPPPAGDAWVVMAPGANPATGPQLATSAPVEGPLLAGPMQATRGLAATAPALGEAQDGQGLLDAMGLPDEVHLRYARSLVNELSPTLRWAAREPYGAQALVFALLLDQDPAIRQRQSDHLETHLEVGLGAETLRLFPQVLATPREFRLPLVDLSLPALRQLSGPQAGAFRLALKAMIAADGRVRLFEWCLSRILTAGLAAGSGTGRGRPRTEGHAACRDLSPDCTLILTLVSRLQNEEATARQALALASRTLDLAASGPGAPGPADPGPLDHQRLDAALDRLQGLSPQAKHQLLQACATAILTDAKVAPAELEVLRAIGAVLNCPIPPLAAPDLSRPGPLAPASRAMEEAAGLSPDRPR